MGYHVLGYYADEPLGEFIHSRRLDGEKQNAGTAKRAPQWWQKHSLEWLYRLIKEPKRMWRRYLIGNPLFIYNILKEKSL